MASSEKPLYHGSRSVLERVKNLFRNLLIYGMGDVATSLISLLLLPVFTKRLPPEVYGVLAMLVQIEAVTKVVFRWGVDTAFMRLYHDCADQAARQRLASTLFWFLIVVNGLLTVIGLASAPWLSRVIIGPEGSGVLVALTIANTFIAGFFFIPYQVLRIGERSKQFITLTFSRAAATIAARFTLVILAGFGALGIVLADIIVTLLFTVLILRFFAPLIRPMFSRAVLRDALGFGLPRIPHSVAQQVISTADRNFLNAFGTLADVGLYSIGASLGLALKLFLSAFESAWTPFFLAVMKEKNAGRVYRAISTYVIAVLVLLVAGLAALAPDVVRIFAAPRYAPAASVIPWIALGVMFQGLYLVGSIGLVITKRTTIYPISTGIAAVASLVANMLLIPRHGMLGAAWANAIAYATLAGVTSAFSMRVYPIRYEWGRLLRIAIAGAVAVFAGTRVTGGTWPALPSLVLRGAAVVLAYGAVLFVSGFFHAGELRILREMQARLRQPKRSAPVSPASEEVEMAGNIAATAPDLDEKAIEASIEAEETPTPDSRDRRR
jgi:O-antigen/teichoic acid export membrane protein